MKLDNIPLIRFDSDLDFHKELSKFEHEIHMRTFYAINKAYNANFNEDVTIAYLNDRDTILGCPPDEWIGNLQMSLEYFISVEEYEKCSEVKELLDKLQA